MQTAKVKITSVSDFETLNKCIFQSTGLLYKLYNNAELMSDETFINKAFEKCDMIDVSMYDFLVDETKTKLNQKETNVSKKRKEISDIEKILSNENRNIISNKKRYKLINKLAILNRNINKDSCFGGKALLRDITRHAQLTNNKNDKLSDKEVLKNKELYEKELKEFREKRKLGIYLIGRANQGGNRKVEFDLVNNKIIFKPNRDTHIEIKFTDKRKELLPKLQMYADAKLIPITVRITDTHICFIYDEAILSGFNFDETEYKRTIKKNNIETKEDKKEIAKQFHKQKEQRMLMNKISTRFAAVDLNPKEIGLVIRDKLNENKDGEFNVLFKYTFNLEKLCDKTGFSSDSKEQKSYNEKRKFEIREVWKKIFVICIHYRVYCFVSEELNFKTNHKKETNVEFNRQVKNIWHRGLTTRLINKWINIFGFKHIEVNPAYSSFVGNMIHNDYDPVAAATEILRRGIVKYIKGSSLYPDIRLINQQKLNYLVGENNLCQNNPTWISLYKHITCAGLRYRNRNDENYFREGTNYYLNSYKSRVKILCL